jgi:hypothetical protein
MKTLFFALLLIQQTAMAATSWPAVRTPLVQKTTILDPAVEKLDPTIPQCMYARKDYESPGFAIPKRHKFRINGQFGCIYYCAYQGQAYYVTHVLRESHFDANIFSEATGGPSRAKWFICPLSVNENTWKSIYNEYGQLITYSVDPDKDYYPAAESPIPELVEWARGVSGASK